MGRQPFWADALPDVFQALYREGGGVNPDALNPRTASNRIAFNSVFDYLIKATAFFLLSAMTSIRSIRH